MLLLLGVLAMVALALPSLARAECCLYWSTGFNGTIGRAPLSGSDPQWNFIHATAAGTFGLAADAGHFYWGGDALIGRAGLDGSDLEEGFIGGLPDSRQASVAVDDAHVYWVERNSIGRANLDGSEIDEGFISTDLPASLALDATHIYWADGIDGTIARADLDGTHIDESFINGVNLPAAVAVDAAHVYWTNFGADSIGRANLDGLGVDQSFIAPASNPWGLAVDDTGIYWTDLDTGGIGHADVDGSGIDQGFIEEAGALNVALGEPGPIGEVKAKRSQRQRRSAIRLRVKVAARQRLTARAAGNLVVGASKRSSFRLKQLPPRTQFVRPGDTEVLRLKPRGARNESRIARALEEGEQATAELTVRLVDGIGNVDVKKLTIRLKRRGAN